jgi:hypothetical protein
MIRKTIFAAALGAGLVFAGAPTTAQAAVDVDIQINLGFGGFVTKDRSCGAGARIVAQRFNFVRARNCKGNIYEYSGRRNGKWYIIKLSSVTGRILDVRRWK